MFVFEVAPHALDSHVFSIVPMSQFPECSDHEISLGFFVFAGTVGLISVETPQILEEVGTLDEGILLTVALEESEQSLGGLFFCCFEVGAEYFLTEFLDDFIN